MNNPDTGDKILSGTITSPTAGSNCPAGGTDPDCSATVDVSVLTIVNTASTSATTPGGVVGYTITATNSGQAPLAGATLTAGFAPALDDAAYNGDATATTGAIALASGGASLIWTGNLSPGASVTITFSITVDNPDTGDKTITNTVTSATPGNTCPAWQRQPGLLRRHHRAHPRPYHHQHRQHRHPGPGVGRRLHPDHHQHRADPVHGRHRHRHHRRDARRRRLQRRRRRHGRRRVLRQRDR